MTNRQRQNLPRALEGALSEMGDGFLGARVMEMADGSNRWGVLAYGVDLEGTEYEIRVQVCPDGEVLASETLLVR